ncbi:phenylalanine 4-monooxygenase [Cytophagales bacterium LB-30]|uniref:phenylalanine 4-monooxygenase n=1 Tax=Shiella aurantiaca TaxID=3058365 RepID=A0ABT8F341_9BACT|nr:phenylalanine 4-monooxygenase [Shiella aurantiaca]MDN4164865.1 phenylalanine 4-monooxygenase [Shiella aurantiaca]
MNTTSSVIETGLRQQYENYTPEDQQVWRILFERQIKNLPKAATKEYLQGIERIRFSADAIPNFEITNALLLDMTGWQLAVVPGIVDDATFFQLMANKHFPATTWLRTMQQLDYLEEPDMFHDVFAHVPLLTNQHFVDFLEALSKIALKHISDPYAIELISRIYWFTIEFGLIREEGEVRIYGAGILSSAGETQFCLSEEPAHFEYDVAKIMHTAYWKDKFQDKYFIIESYEQLYHSIAEIEQVLEQMLAVKK